MQTASFLDYLKFEKRYSPHTLSAYESDLEQFASFLSDQYELNDLSKSESIHIRSWMVYLIDSKITPRSINRKLSTLKSYYKFLLRRQLIDSNPMAKIQSPKSGKRLPVFVSKPNLDRLFDNFEYPEGFTGIRDRMVLETFYTLGIRVSELVGLKITDFDWAARNVKILGKGSKERLVPFGARFEQSVKEYILKRKDFFPDEAGVHLFLNDKGKPVNSSFIYRVVNHYLSMVTTIEKKSPHVLRHSFATSIG
ncbi:MAG: tyrosine-type recombinase/integrase [Saprospiraceae bacterium]